MLHQFEWLLKWFTMCSGYLNLHSDVSIFMAHFNVMWYKVLKLYTIYHFTYVRNKINKRKMNVHRGSFKHPVNKYIQLYRQTSLVDSSHQFLLVALRTEPTTLDACDKHPFSVPPMVPTTIDQNFKNICYKCLSI